MNDQEMTSNNLAIEASQKFRETKRQHGMHVEKYVADKKLEQIIDPSVQLIDGSERGAANLNIWVDGLLTDYKDVIKEKPNMEKAVRSYSEKAKESVMTDLHQTAQQYEELNLPEGTDPTIVAKDNRERSAILESANLLGYKVKEDDNGVHVEPQSRFEVKDEEKTIRTRVNVGIKNLFTDYDTMPEGPLSRPVRRQIVAMTALMAETLRS